MSRKAKIIATLGVSTDSAETIAALISAGMNVARISADEGDHADHARYIETVREVSQKMRVPVGIIADFGNADENGELSAEAADTLRWCLRQGVDIVAQSFVRSAADAQAVRQIIASEQAATGQPQQVQVMAKLETAEAVGDMKAIIEAYDMVMVARGDLSIQLPLEQVPVVQKRAIELSRVQARPAVVATHMLESMVGQVQPTRAEVSDVANAVLDGADALMLRDETACGAYPVEAVAMMSSIITSTEEHGWDRIQPVPVLPKTVPGAISKAAVSVAHAIGATYLCVFTSSGNTARRIGRLRDDLPMLVFTYDESTRRAMTPFWGVDSILVPFMQTTDEMVLGVDTYLLESGQAKRGDKIIVVAGSPPGLIGSTNDLRVLTVGEVVDAAAPGYRRTTSQLMKAAVADTKDKRSKK